MSKNKRTLYVRSEFQTRESESGPVAEGTFVVFNSPTELYEGYFEQVEKGAINIERDSKLHDIAALANHNDDLPLARYNNKTLELWVDDEGLKGRIHFNKEDSDSMNWYQRIKSGVVYQNSFGFYIKDSHTEKRDDGTILNTITDLELIEVSPVTFPAYKDTEIAARKAQIRKQQEKKVEERRKELLKKLEEVIE